MLVRLTRYFPQNHVKPSLYAHYKEVKGGIVNSGNLWGELPSSPTETLESIKRNRLVSPLISCALALVVYFALIAPPAGAGAIESSNESASGNLIESEKQNSNGSAGTQGSLDGNVQTAAGQNGQTESAQNGQTESTFQNYENVSNVLSATAEINEEASLLGSEAELENSDSEGDGDTTGAPASATSPIENENAATTESSSSTGADASSSTAGAGTYADGDGSSSPSAGDDSSSALEDENPSESTSEAEPRNEATSGDQSKTNEPSSSAGTADTSSASEAASDSEPVSDSKSIETDESKREKLQETLADALVKGLAVDDVSFESFNELVNKLECAEANVDLSFTVSTKSSSGGKNHELIATPQEDGSLAIRDASTDEEVAYIEAAVLGGLITLGNTSNSESTSEGESNTPKESTDTQTDESAESYASNAGENDSQDADEDPAGEDSEDSADNGAEESESEDSDLMNADINEEVTEEAIESSAGEASSSPLTGDTDDSTQSLAALTGAIAASAACAGYALKKRRRLPYSPWSGEIDEVRRG
jgi:hypothetical protein